MRIRTKYFLLYVSPLFFAVITALLTFPTASAVLFSLIISVLHECGHLALLIFYGCGIKSVTLSYYGMKILRQDEMKLSLKKEIAVCLAGVTVNFFLSAVFAVLYYAAGNETALKISYISLILGLFNLLPFFSSDGGRALGAFLEYKYGLTESEKALKVISFSTLIPVTASGVFLLVKNGNFTLLICSLYMLISFAAK